MAVAVAAKFAAPFERVAVRDRSPREEATEPVGVPVDGKTGRTKAT